MGAIGWFFLGFVGTSILSTFASPFVNKMADLRDKAFCPNDIWCNTHFEFVASDLEQCSIGSVGYVVGKALEDGDITDDGNYHREGKSLATRTQLCAEERRATNKAIKHLSFLDYYYGQCFVLRVGRQEKSRFDVVTGTESGACISNVRVNPNTNDFEEVDDYKQALVFCIPKAKKAQRIFSKKANLPMCTQKDLESIKKPTSSLSGSGKLGVGSPP